MKINRAEARKTGIQLIKYGVIGVMNTTITLVSFWLLNTMVGWPFVPSNVIASVLGLINSFCWNRSWVFSKGDNWRRDAALFGSGWLTCYTLQMLVSWFLLEGLDWKHMEMIPWLPMKKTGQNIVMIVGMVVFTLSNYAYNRFITFREKKDSDVNAG